MDAADKTLPRVRPNPLDAEAMSDDSISNLVVTPRKWFETLNKSDSHIAKLTCKMEPIIVRLGVAAIGSSAAFIDFLAYAAWSGYTVMQLACGSKEAKMDELKVFAYKGSAFFCAIPAALVIGLINPDGLVESYRSRQLINNGKKKDKEEFILSKVKQAKEFALNKVEEGKRFVLKKVKKGQAFVLEHPATAVGAFALTAVAAKEAGSFILKRVSPN